MTGGFNPYRAGLPPQSQNVSQELISKLMSGGTDSIQSLLGGIQKSGEISRSSKLNDLLATGELDGLTEEQTRQKVAQMTGGQSVNPLVQANIADVMSGQRASQIAKNKAAADLGLEEYKFGNDMEKTKYKAGQDLELEQLKSKLGLNADLTIEEAKAKNDAIASNMLFGNQSSLEKLKHQLKIDSSNKGELPEQWGVLGNGVLYNKTTGDTMLPEEYKNIVKEKDTVESLPTDAKAYVKSLSKNQQENFKEAYASGSIGWKPAEKDSKGNKSGGFFYDLNSSTPLGITISNKREKK